MQLDAQLLTTQLMSALPSGEGWDDRHCCTQVEDVHWNAHAIACWHAVLCWQATNWSQQLLATQSPQGSPVDAQVAGVPHTPVDRH